MSVVIVSGALANKLSNGGATWTRLSWALGLKALGFEVAFVEQIRRGHCVDALGRPSNFEESANLKYFRQVTEQFGLDDLATLTCDDGAAHGLTPSDLDDLVRSATALVNITGHLDTSRDGRHPPEGLYRPRSWLHSVLARDGNIQGLDWRVITSITRSAKISVEPVARFRRAASRGVRSGSRWC